MMHQRDKRFERGFITELFILVHFVGADDDLDVVVLQIHPVHIALKVIVAQESIRPAVQVDFQGRIFRERGRLFQQSRGRLQEGFVGFGIRDGDQVFTLAADHCKIAGKGLPVFRMPA